MPPAPETPPPPVKLKDEGMQDEYGDMSGGDLYYQVPDFELESGLSLDVRVAYRTWGTLSPAADNCLFVAHALTGNAAVDTWWAALLGPGKALDSSRYFIVGANMLGSCYGTTSALDEVPKGQAPWVAPRAGTHAEAAGTRYAADFPYVTIRDTVALHRALLAHLGVSSVHAVVGGSAGGMQALEWTIMYPSLVKRAVVLACGAYQTAWQIAISEGQRQAIYRDPLWNHGFYPLDEPPSHGLAIARQHAMVWYRSSEAYASKFGRRLQPASPGSPAAKALASSGGGGRGAPDSYAVECYLEHQGCKFVDRFDANCYVSLTRTLDSHDVGRDRGSVEEVLAGVKQPVTVVGVTSDVLYPMHMQRELAEHIPRAVLRVVDSVQGHDAFLLESGVVSAYIQEALDGPAGVAMPAHLGEVYAAATLTSPASKPASKPAQPTIDLTDHSSEVTKKGAQKPFQMPTAAVLSLITAEMIAKRKAANLEGIRTAGCLGAVAW